MKWKSIIFFLVVLIITILLWPFAASSEAQQTPELIYKEAQTVNLGNLARRNNGVPPLRWNNQLTQAARWFSWDSLVNQPEYYCGHTDSQGHSFSYRTSFFGFLGFAGGENVACGYSDPQSVINGWMSSEGHRRNLLNPNYREIGLGYYYTNRSWDYYITQDLGADSVYPPVIIENEAPSTTNTQVNLYIYNGTGGGDYMSMGAATQMQVSNDPCFQGAWESYQAEKVWNLSSGQGWRTVYVRLRDALLRTMTITDQIYLGSTVPLAELGEAQMSTTQNQVKLENLSGGGLPLMQFSPSWRVDDSNANFELLWGNGGQVADEAAWGGTAFLLTSGSMEPSAWVYTTKFIKDTPFVAYVRMKVSNNTVAQEVVRVSVTGGGTLTLKGTNFSAANQYQEFPIAFTFPSSESFLIFQFWRTGTVNPDLYIDGITIFTAPQPVTSSITWQFPGGNYRGQGIWVRYTNGSNSFSDLYDGTSQPPGINVSPTSLSFLALRNGAQPGLQTIQVQQTGCSASNWQVSENAAWLTAQASGNAIQVQVNTSGLKTNTYNAEVTISGEGISTITIPVRLKVVDVLYTSSLPLIQR